MCGGGGGGGRGGTLFAIFAMLILVISFEYMYSEINRKPGNVL